jgi:hypothetical protein
LHGVARAKHYQVAFATSTAKGSETRKAAEPRVSFTFFGRRTPPNVSELGEKDLPHFNDTPNQDVQEGFARLGR